MAKTKGRQAPGGESKAEMKRRQSVALFRFSLIAPLLHLERGSPELTEGLQEIAAREHEIPGSRRRTVAVATLREWLRKHEEGQFEALYPKRRLDQGQPRSLPAEVVALLEEIKADNRQLTVKQVIRQAQDSGRVPEGLHLAHSTVNRWLKRAGLMEPDPERAAGQDRRRFAWEQANELWMADIMHGPKVAPEGDGRRRKKAYLLALIDDATRVVPHAVFAHSESAGTFLQVLQAAILKRGTPRRLYVDNGAAFRSQALHLACAQLGIGLAHARPYQPAGKGKIERWFRRVRSQLLPVIGPADRASLARLNRRLALWVEDEYHHTPHRGLEGDTPLDRWARHSQSVSYPDPRLDLRVIFSLRFRRKVSRARTVSLHGRMYETAAELVGERVDLLQDPAAPPGRPLLVEHEGELVGEATVLDLHANARRHRRRKASKAPAPAPDAGRAVPRPAPIPPSSLALRELEATTPAEPGEPEPREEEI